MQCDVLVLEAERQHLITEEIMPDNATNWLQNHAPSESFGLLTLTYLRERLRTRQSKSATHCFNSLLQAWKSPKPQQPAAPPQELGPKPPPRKHQEDKLFDLRISRMPLFSAPDAGIPSCRL